MDSKSFLGRGFGFPFRVEEGTGKIAMVSHEEDIRQSVELILHTYRGERVMRPDFGARTLTAKRRPASGSLMLKLWS